ncbi:uncharacterized protein si:ch211-126c2.4 [Xyrauchen texanus]|uniref:uncharacterized protein si:ch211-126c2.4 n=1 Tax=Xyrauchen texanus TaxID=154827 RepID=UPI002242927E|nr:uncharacterized protein si:ch211-126c2.4 [Xyrauchen texanus]XP_052006162.1 uncharacterized protein si:ch211-126c2.4 [Xyrauchen texanus]
MESFLRWRLAQARGNILGGSALQKPVSSYPPIKLPDLCSSFYSIADEPFPQVSGFLDDTVGPSFLSNEAGTALNSPACTPSESITKHKDEGVLATQQVMTEDSDNNSSKLGAHCQSVDGSMSTKPIQNDKDISSATKFKADEEECKDFTPCSTESSKSLEKCDLMSVELKNSTFNVTEDLKEQSDSAINSTVDLPNIRERNSTFESVPSQEGAESGPKLNSTVDIDVPMIKTQSGNTTVDLAQTCNTKVGSDPGGDATVDIPNLDCTHDKVNSHGDNISSPNTTTEQPNEKIEGNINIQQHVLDKEKPEGSLNSTEEHKTNCPITKNAEDPNLKVNVTVDILEQTASAPLHTSGEIVHSSSAALKSDENTFTKNNTTTDLTLPENPVLKNITVEITHSCTELTGQANDGSNSVVGDSKSDSNNREAEVETSIAAFVCSVEAPDDSPELKADESLKNSERPGCAYRECVLSSHMGNISRNSIFSLDDTVDMRTSFMVTSTPIVFGKESRFEILRDVKPTPMRKRLSVINSIEVQSNDSLVGVSTHDGTHPVLVSENSNQSQKVSSNYASGNSKTEPANENKPPTKPTAKGQLPQRSSKLSYPKSCLPPWPQSSLLSSVAVKPKTIQAPQVLHQSNVSSGTLLSNNKMLQHNKGKNTGAAKNTVSTSTVKTSVVSSVSGYNFTAVSRHSSSGLPQMKPSGLQPPTRKRLALKTAQITQSSIETIQAQSSNKPTGIQGMRTRNSLLPSLGQKHMNNDGLPLAKRKKNAPSAQPTVETDSEQPAEGAHKSDCVNCLQHQDKLERCLQELVRLRSECKNWGPLQKKLEMCLEEIKRI